MSNSTPLLSHYFPSTNDQRTADRVARGAGSVYRVVAGTESLDAAIKHINTDSDIQPINADADDSGKERSARSGLNLVKQIKELIEPQNTKKKPNLRNFPQKHLMFLKRLKPKMKTIYFCFFITKYHGQNLIVYLCLSLHLMMAWSYFPVQFFNKCLLIL